MSGCRRVSPILLWSQMNPNFGSTLYKGRANYEDPFGVIASITWEISRFRKGLPRVREVGGRALALSTI